MHKIFSRYLNSKIKLYNLNIFVGNFGPMNLGIFSGMIATDRVPTIQSFNSDAELDDTMAATEVDSKVKTKLLSMWNNVKYGTYIRHFGSKIICFKSVLCSIYSYCRLL